MYTIEDYSEVRKESWLRCRALAYMRSAFNDEITGEKENVPASRGVSLVAIADEQVVGIAEAIFLDSGKAEPATYRLADMTKLTALDTMAVHPDYQHQGIAKALLLELRARLAKRGGVMVIYTLDDEPANGLYRTIGADLCYTASIAYGHNPHNHTPEWTRLRATPDHEMAVLDANGEEIPVSLNGESYYVGRKANLALLTDIERVATEHVYTLVL